MDPNDFSNSSPGRVLRTLKGYWAFIPNPLPPTIEWSTSLISALGEAERNLGQARQPGRHTAFATYSGASVHPAGGGALLPYRRERALRW